MHSGETTAGHGAKRVHAKWFKPRMSGVWRMAALQSLLWGSLLMRNVHRGQAWSKALLLADLVTFPVMFGFMFIALTLERGGRASVDGLHRNFFGVIPWESITSASRYGSVIRIQILLTVGRWAWSSVRLTPELTTAIRSWVRPDHPLCAAIQGEGPALDPLPVRSILQNGAASSGFSCSEDLS